MSASHCCAVIQARMVARERGGAENHIVCLKKKTVRYGEHWASKSQMDYLTLLQHHRDHWRAVPWTCIIISSGL